MKLGYYQTGDLLYFPLGYENCVDPVAKDIPSNATVKKDNVIHVGNTGNNHVVNGDAELFVLDGKIFINAKEKSVLAHEEHKDISIPAGKYEVRHVVEKDHFSDLVRPVVD